ncbi:glutamate-5-semialdehyde dehydrogenase [uncultured Ruminococcus sp.]|uniref:glutamate-5-semialdehyde dehydrogenase n=1 Tax=uncultured Ruminococcus sp. TaxID=165186 RepID=UPI00292E2125|nr:glutamate-5-semialdehyde dehydrogenase [uncultured Ruminococcus sp.]
MTIITKTQIVSFHSSFLIIKKGSTMTTHELLVKAKEAKALLGAVEPQDIDRALLQMADQLEENTDAILTANALDIEAARGKISDVMIDRLMLSDERIKGMAQGIREVAALPSPLGRVLKHHERPDGLVIERVSVALGVVAIIYESRPNVTSDAAALALKSGNVCVLRCGKEAHKSAAAIVEALRAGLKAAGLNEDMVLLVEDTTRTSANELMTADGYVDLLIPRGGKGLISAIVKNATVPCIQTGTGICHIYIDSAADIDMALKIVENAKCSRPSVCNAEEVLVVAEDIAEEFLPRLKTLLVDGREVNPVELRLDEKAAAIIDGTPAGEDDFDTEFLDYILAVKIVKDVREAVTHINAHSTGHSEAIVTADEEAAAIFTRGIDSSSVYVNASTRFTDGGEFGLGCEMGISTQKLHARGPMGLEELNTYKYIITGRGNIR